VNQLPEQPTDEISNLLAGFALKSLAPDEAAFVARQLPRKEAWRDELDGYRAVAQTLPYMAEPQDVPVRIRAGILARIDEIESQVPESVKVRRARLREAATQPQPSRTRRLARIGLATALPATMVAIVFVMYTVIMQGRINDQQSELASYAAEQRQAAEILTQPDGDLQQVIQMVVTNAAPLSRGRLIIDAQSNSGLLAVRNMPQLAEDEVYVVWVVPDTVNREFASLGMLKIDELGAGQLILTPPDAFERYLNITITRETDPNVTHPTGPEVMSSGI
jgi:hypothetical protein